VRYINFVIIIIIIIICLPQLEAVLFCVSCFDDTRSLIRNILVILPVLGVTWVFGVVAVNSDLVAFQFVFAVANSLQVRFTLVMSSEYRAVEQIYLSDTG